MQQFFSYIRVSTTRQGHSGLGLEAQRVAVANYLAARGDLVTEFCEVESGRKSAKQRPELARALAACKSIGGVLVIGKLDRLARDVRFFLEVIDDSGVDIRFADLPDVCPKTDEGRMILVSMANFAEFEARRIATRTRAALTAARARGVQLGTAGARNLRRNVAERQSEANAFALRLQKTVAGLQASGLSHRAMVKELNGLGVAAPRGGTWGLSQFQRLLQRIELAQEIVAPQVSLF
jgi:DNA invertase Pin-like site-specific DNA recombinase